MANDGEVAAATLAVVEAFCEATNRHDIDAMLALCRDDVVLDGTSPPDGERFEGHPAVRALWTQLFRESPNARVETEDLIVVGSRCTALLRYVFDSANPNGGHVRAVDVITVEDGRIVEKLSYVKG